VDHIGYNGDVTGRDVVTRTAERTFFGHPRGLATLFFTEMWERFSYYGMRAILALYLYSAVSAGGLGVPQSSALSLVSVYGASVYMSSLPGGWVADRLLGARRSVLYGGILIMCGHFTLAVPGVLTVYAGLLLIVLGTGLLKPNISEIVGELYGDDDPRRDAGFSIFYMGINLGALLAPLVCGYLGQRVDWHLGFAAAGVGMAAGLLQYVLGARWLGDAGMRPSNPLPPAERRRVLGRAAALTLAGLTLLIGLAAGGVLTGARAVDAISVLSVVLPAAYFAIMIRSARVTPEERSRILAYVPLFVAAALFWLIFEQASTVLTAFADEKTRTSVLGIAFPSSWYQSVNPVAILVLAPVFAGVWMRLGPRQPSTPRKFAVAMVVIGSSFFLVTLAGRFTGPDGRVSPVWLLGVYVVQTVAELLLSPIGLSVTTKLAPVAFRSQTVGLWFLAVAAGQGIGAQVVTLYGRLPDAVYFGAVGSAAVAAAILLYLLAPRLEGLMRGVR
jgi:POT family proton-dependent oligopeptide transporter